MGMIDGGTRADHVFHVRHHIFSAVIYDPKRRKSIEQILEERGEITDEKKKTYQLEADRMIAQKFLYRDLDKKDYVFSKDKEGKYFFQPATRIDKIINYVFNLWPI